MKLNPLNLIHVVLGHSYLVYFFSILIGLGLQIWYPYQFSHRGVEGLGLILIIVGPLLMYWAQHTTDKTAKLRGEWVNDWKIFYRGPYTLTRSPTHLGLFFLVLGFSAIINSLWLLMFSTFAFLITRCIFIRKEESLLVKKYTDAYTTYQKKVRF